MNSIPKFDEFLLTETGLPWEQIARLYNAGHPWPSSTAHDLRKAGLAAQANGVFFSDVLSEIERETEAQANAVLAKLEADDRACRSIPIDERIRTLSGHSPRFPG